MMKLVSNQFDVCGMASIVMLVVLLPVAAADPLIADAGELKIMSFNVRYSSTGVSEAKTENNWDDPDHPRRERTTRVILDYGADILGIQEALSGQVQDLRTALSDFDFYGVGRDDGKAAGEYAGIFYRRNRFQRTDQGSFWLSATPEKPGTTFHTKRGAVPRVASWVKLVDRQSDDHILVLNMHWDHASEPARRQSARLVRSRFSMLAAGLPAIVMGDLNSNENSPAVKELMGANGSDGPPLADSFREVYLERKPDEASFNNWEGITAGSRIDFILHTADFCPVAAAIDRTAYDGRWPSDHYPVTATLRRTAKK